MSKVSRITPSLPALAAQINAEHEAAERAINDSLEHARKCGELLIQAKAGCEHGEWGEWLRENFAASERAARQYMQIARRWTELVANRHDGAVLTISEARDLLAEPREETTPAPEPVDEYVAQNVTAEYVHVESDEPEPVTVLTTTRNASDGVQYAPEVVTKRDGSIDKLKTMRAQREAQYGSVEQEDTPAPAANGNRLAVHHSSDTGEWYTPPEIIDAVVAALGGIDLDPCSNPGEPAVAAAKHYTYMDDGLAQKWDGRVYMNPPYGRGIGEWTAKLRTAFEAGDVTEAIALVPARTDTAWMHDLRVYARCFVRGRISFSGHENAAPFPSCAIYFGPNVEKFTAAFASLGDTYTLMGV